MTQSRYVLRIGFIILIFSLVFLGCSAEASNSGSDTESAASGALKVAMLLPGPIDDTGWSQSGYEGLKHIEEELGAEIAYTASVPEGQTEQEEILRQYAEDGFDFIIAHGGEYVPALEVVAAEFPQTRFAAITSYGGNNKNLGALAVRADEGGYLAGVAAALKTKTNKVAYIGGQEFPSTAEEVAALQKGVSDTNPDVEVTVTWVDSWSDQDKAREMAQTLIDDGADVLAVDADIAGLAVLELASQEGVAVIGWVQDQNPLAPDAVIASVLQRLDALFLEAAILVKEGRWEGKQYRLGLNEGVIDLSQLYGDWTPEQQDLIKQVKEDIIAGEIDILP